MSSQSIFSFALLLLFPVLSSDSPAPVQTPHFQAIYYVAPNGLDSNPGTLNLPFGSIKGAQAAVRSINSQMSGDIVVYLRGGTYAITSPLAFDVADSGTNGHTVHYKAYNGETPVISGGRTVTGWATYKGPIFKAHFDRDAKLRQLYVGGRRAIMARGPDFPLTPDVQGYGSYEISGKEPWAIDAGRRFAGYTFRDANLERYKHPEDVELCSKAGFGYHTIGISKIKDLGNRRVVFLQQPIGSIAQSVPQDGGAFISNRPDLKAVSVFHFQNAIELLKAPGQFYFDRSHKTLYYYKRPDEDLRHVEVIAPVSEGLLRLHGTSTEHRISNISFEGITFAYSHYSLTEVSGSWGDTTIQSIALFTKYKNDGESTPILYRNVTPQLAAVECENSSNISFLTDVFEHIGEVGLSLGNDANRSKVIGNVLHDIGSSAINVGDPRNVYVGDGDFAKGVEGVPSGDVIQDNYISDVSVDTMQAPGVSIFYSQKLDFLHNEVVHVPYTGISMGWGWVAFTRLTRPNNYSRSSANNKLDYNKVSEAMLSMHDGAGIYVLGEQPGSQIDGNYFGQLGGFSEAASIYLDQGSRFVNVSNNYSDNSGGWFFVWGKAAQVYNIRAQNNYSSVVRGEEGKNLNDSPQFTNARSQPTSVDELNKHNAGLEAEFLYLKHK